MKTETILKALIGIFCASLVYAADWNRAQDKELANMDKILERQKTINENNVKLNEQMQKYNELRFQQLQPNFMYERMNKSDNK